MSTVVEQAGLGFRIVDSVIGPLTGRHLSEEDAWKAAGLKPGTQLSESVSDGPYDPADNTVADVVAYLTDADEAERARVLEAESAGKGRVGITGWVPPEPTTED